jgi:hypothetical protein
LDPNRDLKWDSVKGGWAEFFIADMYIGKLHTAFHMEFIEGKFVWVRAMKVIACEP